MVAPTRRLAVAGLLLLLAISAHAATIRVPADEPTIQAGIDAASSGDTVLVAPDTYIENIRFRRKSIVVVSEAGPAATIIDGSQPSHPDTGSVAIVDGPTALLEGFTLRGGTGTVDMPQLPPGSWAGGGVALVGNGVWIVGNWITENHLRAPRVYGGAGIYSNAQDVLIANNRIFSNICEGSEPGFPTEGGGIGVVRAGPYAPIFENEIFDNVADYGGGFHSEALSGALRYNVIACNQNGGLVKGGFIIANNTVVDNTGFGVQWPAMLERNTITHNTGEAIVGGCPGWMETACNNFFANGEEDSTCFGPGTENISVDPLYGETGCGASYCLLPDSPLLPENSPPGCDLIGARGLCTSTAVHDIDALTSPDYASSPLVARPNPFNPSTTISFRLDRDSVIELDVVNARGRVVARLHSGFLAAGRHEIEWDGRDVSGTVAASGAYIVVLRSPAVRFSQKLLLIR